MPRTLPTISLLLIATAALADAPKYPATPTKPVTDELHGVKLTDPYRWLEDEKAADVQAWVTKENEVTRTYLDKLPERAAVIARLEKLIRVPTESGLRVFGSEYYFTKRDPQQNQAILYCRGASYDAAARGRAIFDPNTYSSDGTIAMDWYFPSDDGKLVALGTSVGGSENSTLQIIDANTAEPMAERIPGTKFCSLAWLPDASGFYYTRYPLPKEVPAGDENYFNHVYFHKLGTKWKDDPKVWGEGEPKEKRADVETSADHKRLFMSTRLDWAKNDLFVRDISAAPNGAFTPVAKGLDALTSGDYLGDRLLLLTNYRAPRYRVVEAVAGESNPEKWKDLIPQQRGVIQSMSIVDGKIVLGILDDVCSRIVIYDGNGKQADEVTLPTLGAVSAINGNYNGTDFFFAFESFAYPPTSYRYDLKGRKLEQIARVPIDIDPNAYETKQVWFNSKDGTKVPMFLVFKKGLKFDGQCPTLLNGYGGFNVASTPRFRNGLFVWLDRGGVYAVANIRGGGEFGSEWHHAGRLEKKQNCFDDFIAAARYLCDNKISNPKKLAAIGGSNGGLLMGAMITQAPELFRAIICAVPLLDMIRYQQFSMARFWIQEYGSSENPEQFKYILKYSPYQNVTKSNYPAVLIETGDSDGRVDPCHARKMAALLQANNTSATPILLRYEAKAGHGAGKPISKIVDAQADEWVFLMNELGVK